MTIEDEYPTRKIGIGSGYSAPFARLQKSGQTPRRVSVIVAARNQSQWLAECLDSIKCQTVPPHQIIYVDDGSTDTSLSTARACGVHVVAKDHGGVVSARQAGFLESEGDYLLFVDGDNTLPRTFIEDHLEAIEDSDADFSACSKQYFGDKTHLWSPDDVSEKQLWNRNQVDTSALIRREAFVESGGWKDNSVDTLWDWDLFLRVSQIGEGVVSNATLNYRSHSQNNKKKKIKDKADYARAAGVIRRSASQISVCLAYGGRLPTIMPRWFEAICCSCKDVKKHLFVIDDSRSGFLNDCGQTLRYWDDQFESIRVRRQSNVGIESEIRRESREWTARRLSSIYNRFLDESPGNIAWFVEDDVIVPNGACQSLLQELTDGEFPRSAVSGLYKSRFEETRYVAAQVQKGVKYLIQAPDEPIPVDLTGTGCMMVLKPVVSTRFRPFWKMPGTDDRYSPAHDWNFSWSLKESGSPVILVPDVRCRHYLNAVLNI